MNPRPYFRLFARPAALRWAFLAAMMLVALALMGGFLSPAGTLFCGAAAGAVVSGRLEELRRSSLAWSLPGLRRDCVLPVVFGGVLVAVVGTCAEVLGARLRWRGAAEGFPVFFATFLFLGYSSALWARIGRAELRRRGWLPVLLGSLILVLPFVLSWIVLRWDELSLLPLWFFLLQGPSSSAVAWASAALAVPWAAWLLARSLSTKAWRDAALRDSGERQTKKSRAAWRWIDGLLAARERGALRHGRLAASLESRGANDGTWWRFAVGGSLVVLALSLPRYVSIFESVQSGSALAAGLVRALVTGAELLPAVPWLPAQLTFDLYLVILMAQLARLVPSGLRLDLPYPLSRAERGGLHFTSDLAATRRIALVVGGTFTTLATVALVWHPRPVEPQTPSFLPPLVASLVVLPWFQWFNFRGEREGRRISMAAREWRLAKVALLGMVLALGLSELYAGPLQGAGVGLQLLPLFLLLVLSQLLYRRWLKRYYATRDLI